MLNSKLVLETYLHVVFIDTNKVKRRRINAHKSFHLTLSRHKSKVFLINQQSFYISIS